MRCSTTEKKLRTSEAQLSSPPSRTQLERIVSNLLRSVPLSAIGRKRRTDCLVLVSMHQFIPLPPLTDTHPSVHDRHRRASIMKRNHFSSEQLGTQTQGIDVVAAASAGVE